MGVMTYMRDRMHIILGILILAFLATIIFSWGMGYSGQDSKQNIIAEINGQEIAYEQFINAYNQQTTNYREQSGQELNETTRLRIRDQVWDNMINEVLVNQAIDTRKITVQGAELFHFLETNPPEFLQNQPAFMTDDKFDYEKYLTALHNPQGDEWVQVEQIYADMLKKQKLQDEITANVVVSEEDVLNFFSNKNIKYSIEYLSIPFSQLRIEDISVSDDEIRSYYRAHKEENYAVPEKRIVQYITLIKAPSKEDTSLVINEIEEIKYRLEEGEKFEDLARIYSSDGSAANGGDLDYFGHGQMVKPFEDAAFAAKIGEVVGPIETRFGYHLIKVTDKKMEGSEPKIRASHILLKVETGPNTIDDIMSNARLFAYDAEDQGFEKALETYKFIPDTSKSGIDKKSYYFQKAGYATELTRWAFGAKPGNISPVIETETAIIVAQLLTINEPTYKTMDEVKASIEREIQREKREIQAKVVAQDVYAKAAQGVDFGGLKNDSLNIKYQTAAQFTIETAPGAFRNNELFATVLHQLELNEVSKPIKTTRDYSIIRLRNKSKFDDAQFARDKADLYSELLTQKQNAFISQWLTETKESAKIKDYRDRFF